jgi:hypothetical protein
MADKQDAPICFRLPPPVVAILDGMRHDDGSWGQYKSRTGALITLAMLGAGREWSQIAPIIEKHCRQARHGDDEA